MKRKPTDPPHRTPNPEGPHLTGSTREHRPASRPRTDEIDLDSMNFDSCLDDLNLKLTLSANDPDPNLIAGGLTPDKLPVAGVAETPASGAPAVQPQARTSEVFPALDLGTNLKSSETAASGIALEESAPAGLSRRAETAGGLLGAFSKVAQIASRAAKRVDEPESDDSDDSRFPWGQLLVLSYASALTFAMTWMLWRGRGSTGEAPSAVNSKPSPAEPNASAVEPAAVVPLPALPAENVAKIGQVLRVGDLEVTPLGVAMRSVKLMNSIDPLEEREVETSSLVMKLKFHNASSKKALVPLAPAFIRDSTAVFDRSFVEGSDGQRIGVFPLAMDSEWSISEQGFPSLEPGGVAETIVASAPVMGELPPEMTWRLRLRIGAYRTDVVGVKFRKSEVEVDSQ